MHLNGENVIGREQISLGPVVNIYFSYIVLILFRQRDHDKNQRTNGPVNAHLRSASYTNKHI